MIFERKKNNGEKAPCSSFFLESSATFWRWTWSKGHWTSAADRGQVEIYLLPIAAKRWRLRRCPTNCCHWMPSHYRFIFISLLCVFPFFFLFVFDISSLFFCFTLAIIRCEKKKSCPDLLKWPAIIGRLMEPRPLIVYLTTVSIINSHTDPSIWKWFHLIIIPSVSISQWIWTKFRWKYQTY